MPPADPQAREADACLRPSALVSVRDLRIAFPLLRGTVIRRRVGALRAVDGVSLDIARGETVGLVGESGCGKSTFARAVLGLVRPTGGEVVFDGTSLGHLPAAGMRGMRRRMQMIFQDSFASLSPRMKVADIIAEPIDIHRRFDAARRRRRIEQVMRLVGLDPALASRYPHEFSAARGSASTSRGPWRRSPSSSCATSPCPRSTSPSRRRSSTSWRRFSAAWDSRSCSSPTTSRWSGHLCNRIAVMYLGRVVEVTEGERLVAHPRHPYTRALLSAVPVPDPEREAERTARREVLEGDPPSPLAPPAGCRFCTRCPSAREVMRRRRIDCASVEPTLVQVEAGHHVACHLDAG